jgi:uncharacterized protein (TIGR00730 family)
MTVPADRADGAAGSPATATRIFPTAEQDAFAACLHTPQTPQTMHPAYKLAYADTEFLHREELRPVRLQLELLKPELMLQEHKIGSTFVIYGSARLPEAGDAQAALEKAATPEAKRIAQSVLEKASFYEEARKLAVLASQVGWVDGERQFVVVSGGGPGIMEAANRGATEAGAPSIGLNIVLPHEQAPNSFVTPSLSFLFHYFALRKMHFLMRARAVCVFPGGFGTLDELFETLTLIQTQKITPIPVLLYGKAYWQKIINFQALVDEGVVSPADLNLFHYVETAEEGWGLIKAHYNLP